MQPQGGIPSCMQLRFQGAFLWLLMTFHGLTPSAAGTRAGGDSGSSLVPEQVRLSEILVSTPQPYDPPQVAEARHKAEELLNAIRQGGIFADLAKTYSQGATASAGGDIGYFKHGSLAPSLEEIVFRMKVGDVSDVVRTKQGFVILKVTDNGKHPDLPLEVLNQPITAELKPYLNN